MFSNHHYLGQASAGKLLVVLTICLLHLSKTTMHQNIEYTTVDPLCVLLLVNKRWNKAHVLFAYNSPPGKGLDSLSPDDMVTSS